MICYFNRNETNFTHNGLGVLDDNIINTVVTEELNGIFKLEFDYPLQAPHADGLVHERIIRCPVPNMTPQLFRISERESTIGGLFHVVAYHVFYDLVQNLIEDTFIVNRNGQQAIQQILNAGQFSHPFTGNSNITAFNTARIVRMNIAETLLDGSIDNGFMSRWGGEIVRDNFHVAIQRVRGSDNGVAIRDKKNLTGYRANVDFGTVVTRIMPQGFDGLFLPERFVDSPRIGQYLTPRIRVIEYSQVRARVGRLEDDEDALPLPQAHALLRTLAAQEYSEHRIDLPTATYEIEFAPLERTEEYKDFAVLETVNIGDTVRVIHEEDGLDISSRVVSYQYNPLTQSYIAVTLGSDTPKFTNVARDIQRIEIGVNIARDEANFALQSASGRRTNFYGSVEPRNARSGDIWFRENGDRLELWIFETRDGIAQWWPLISDLTQEELRQATEAARLAAEKAEIAGQQAYEAGQEARELSVQAKAESLEAIGRANTAFDNANNAIAQAGTANANLISLTTRVATAEASINLLPTTVRLAVESQIAPAPLIRGWERHRWNNTNGNHQNDVSSIRGTHDIEVVPGEQFIGQDANGASRTFRYFWYNATGGFISHIQTVNATTAPAGAVVLRVSTTWTDDPNDFTGTVVRGNTRIDLTNRTVSAATMLMQNNFINLRVAKGEIINQINISTEGILIAGNRIRITGQTTIDNAVIGTAHIVNLAVTTAKIADLAVSSAKIANLAVTSAKIGNLAVGTAQIGNLAVTTGKIVDLAVTNAKIATIDAAKITTGILNANRIGANSITANHVTTNFLQALTGNSAIRITGTTISYFSGGNVTSQINANGFELTRNNIRIGRIGTNNITGQPSWRGLVFDLENAGNYMSWSWRETANAATYTIRFAYYRSRLQNGMERGFQVTDPIFIRGGQSAASGTTIVTNNWGFWTFGGVNCLGRVTTNSRAGLALGGSSLFIGSQGSWVDFNAIRAICAAISNRRVFLPASSAGLSSWWDVSIPSMTTWST